MDDGQNKTGAEIDAVDARGAEVILKKRRSKIILFVLATIVTAIAIWAYITA